MAKLITRSVNLVLLVTVFGLGGFWLNGTSAMAASQTASSYDGFLRICKETDPNAPVSGEFSFTVANQTVKVEVGKCSAPITFNVGDMGMNYVITELQTADSQLIGIRVDPSDRFISSDLAARRATVKVIAGNTSSVYFKNRSGTPPSSKKGRMTGGGSVFTSAGMRVTHGFQLRCNAMDKRQNLQVNWSGNRFHLESLETATCIDDPAIAPPPPAAPFDTYIGSGTGRYNGVAGATIKWTFSDAGEPGTADRAKIVITNAKGNVVLTVEGFLKKGNHQAHR